VSDDPSHPAFLADNSDPEMQRAYEQARCTFRYFWREVAWDRRRIVPALALAGVKAPFTDGERRGRTDGKPTVEHMWLSDVDFDGRLVIGKLINSPRWLKTIKEGDSARFTLGELSDWLFSFSGVAYGGFTVNLLRSRMTARERREHDAAWGLDFGDPASVRFVREEQHQALSKDMVLSLKDQLAKNPSLLSSRGHFGWTNLHHDASTGNAACVQVLLEAGADPNALTDHGVTALQLATVLGWDAVVALLTPGPP
jgi:uncharacterized protein YegJ (DUF2314 family)